MKIALVLAPAWITGVPPLALASLAAYLRSLGHQVQALDLNIALYRSRSKKYSGEWDWERSAYIWSDPQATARFIKDNEAFLEARVREIAARGTELAGFSVYQSTLQVSLYLARRLKETNKKIIVVFGGPEAGRALSGNELIRDANVDFVVQGEGELALAEIAAKGKAGVFCKGALVRRGGKITDCGDRELAKDLDALPFPDFSDYDWANYTGDFTPIISSRGCCNNCVFCSERNYWKRFRTRSAENIYAEILFRLKAAPDRTFFGFQDCLVNGSVAQLEKLADLLIAGGTKIHWGGSATIRKEMTPELFRKLRKSGCVLLGYGVETASVPLMLKVGKTFSRGADPDRIIRGAHRAGIGCILNFMFGLPGETEEDFRETLDFLKRNRAYIDFVHPIPTFCNFPKGTYAHDHPAEAGIRLTQGPYWESADGANTYLVRLRRFEEFCRLACRLKIKSFYPHPRLVDRNRLLADYFFETGDPAKGARHFLKAVKSEPLDVSALKWMELCCRKAGLPYDEASYAGLLAWNRKKFAGRKPPSVEKEINLFLKRKMAA